MATQLLGSGGTYFIGGADSVSASSFLGGDQFVMGCNVVNRGGIIQTRPGFRSVVTLPPGNMQGMTVFKPTDGNVTIVVAVDGFIYAIPEPFDTYDIIQGLSFNPNSKIVVFKEALQTTDYDDNGIPYFLNSPKNLLFIQDINTRAGYWDGAKGRHLNPNSPETAVVDDNTGEPIPQKGYNETPVGLWMEFSGNRLWVGRGEKLYASDYGNPLKFTESLYLAEGRAFYMPEPITGMIQRNAGSPLIVFGESSYTVIRSDILDRTQWLNTEDFQVTDHSVGCVSGRSIVQSHGQIWWYSKEGLTNLNATMQLQQDSRFTYYDSPMMMSKGMMSPNTDEICGVAYENYLLMSVPVNDMENKHTWVLDQLPVQGGNPSWNGYWTGIRPMQWGKGMVRGEQRLFGASRDSDGGNRIWEAFSPERTDCGCPITSWVMSKGENFDSMNYKRFGHADLFIEEMLGNVSLSVRYAGTRGSYKEILNKDMVATDGVFNRGNSVIDSDTVLYNARTQSRVLRTEEAPQMENECDSCGVEGDMQTFVDREFTLLFLWSGRMGIKGYRAFAVDQGDQEIRGKCEGDEEEEFRSITERGCGAMASLVEGSAWKEYDSVQSYTVKCPDDEDEDEGYTVSAYARSLISQKDADRKALCKARALAESTVVCVTTRYLVDEEGNYLVTEDGDRLIFIE